MARFIVVWMVLAIPLMAYQVMSVGSSSVESQSFELEGIPLGAETIDESGLGGNSQYGQLTGLSAQGSTTPSHSAWPDNHSLPQSIPVKEWNHHWLQAY